MNSNSKVNSKKYIKIVVHTVYFESRKAERTDTSTKRRGFSGIGTMGKLIGNITKVSRQGQIALYGEGKE